LINYLKDFILPEKGPVKKNKQKNNLKLQNHFYCYFLHLKSFIVSLIREVTRRNFPNPQPPSDAVRKQKKKCFRGSSQFSIVTI